MQDIFAISYSVLCDLMAVIDIVVRNMLSATITNKNMLYIKTKCRAEWEIEKLTWFSSVHNFLTSITLSP